MEDTPWSLERKFVQPSQGKTLLALLQQGGWLGTNSLSGALVDSIPSPFYHVSPNM